MLNKIKSIIYFIFILLFVFLIIFNYFSESNKNIIKQNRKNLFSSIEKSSINLPKLSNDTQNIFEYPSSDNNDKKHKKRHFWNLLNN